MRTKYLTYFLIVFVVAASLVLGYLLLNSNGGAVTSTDDSAVLIYEGGTVSYKLSESDIYAELTEDEISLPSGSYVKTDEAAFASIFLPDNSLISLSENTEIQINYSPEAVDLKQLVGETWNRVQTLSNGGTFQIESPNTIAAVRGTIFDVIVEGENSTTVHVDESIVEVSELDTNENGEKVVVESVDVNQGEWIKVSKDDPEHMMKEEAGEEFTQRDWVQKNKDLDEDYMMLSKDEMKEVLKDSGSNSSSTSSTDADVLGLESGLDKEIVKEVSSELQDVESILTITHRSCQDYSSKDMKLAIEKITKYSEYLVKPKKLVEILEGLLSSCEDAKLTVQEANKLEKLIKEF